MPSNEYVEFRAALQYCLRQFQNRAGFTIEKQDLFRRVAEQYAISIKKLEKHLEAYYVGSVLLKSRSKNQWVISPDYTMPEYLGGPSVIHVLEKAPQPVEETPEVEEDPFVQVRP